MNIALDIISVAFSSIGLPALIVLHNANSNNKLANRILVLSLLMQMYIIFGLTSWNFLFYLRVPHFFRTASPFQYAFPALSYLYLRMTINGEVKLRSTDWLFFLPSIFHVIELTPFFFSSTSQKLSLILNIDPVNRPFGTSEEFLIPGAWHFLLKVLNKLVFVFLQWKVFLFFARDTQKQWNHYKNIYKNWFLFYLSVNTSVVLVILFNAILFAESIISISLIPLLLSISIALKSGMFLIKKELLLGLHPIQGLENGLNISVKENKGSLIERTDRSKLDEYREKINYAIEKDCIFKKEGLSLTIFSEKYDIPKNILSALINHDYQMNFNEFINKNRVEFAVQMIKNPAFKNYSLEGLGQLAGFQSKTTFYTSFKKFTGQTPQSFFLI